MPQNVARLEEKVNALTETVVLNHPFYGILPHSDN